MSAEATGAALAAVLDSLTLVRGQLDALAKSNSRIEQTHQDILHRLDTIDAGQAGVTDLVPVLETILTRAIEDREISRAGFARTAEVAAFAYSAAMGNRGVLPVEVVDDPLLERFMLTQPADFVSQDRALVEWRKAASGADTNELTGLLARQYQPSPTDTVETRVLRYQLAAITRAELEGRGAALPATPAGTIAQDRSPIAQKARSEKLARLWRAGAGTALFAEAELAGAVDLFANAERRAGTMSEERLSEELAALHRQLGSRIETGERPSLHGDRAAVPLERTAGHEEVRER